MKKSLSFTITYLLVLTLFTGYVLMDTFVISRVYGEATSESNYDANDDTGMQIDVSEDADVTDEVSNPWTAEVVSNDSAYSDGNISISLSTIREYNTNIYVADVELSSTEYLKTALAQGVYGKNVNEETSSIAEGVGAILAINGDYYGTRERGFVIKNGILYRDVASSGQEDLVIYSDGSFGIISEDEVSADELIESGVVQTLSFGPALVENGSIAVSEYEEISGRSTSSNPRTAIGMVDERHYIFLVSDGRTGSDAGLSLYQLATIMQKYGASTAYNLDGGGSSTMYFNGNVINNPIGGRAGHDSGSERSVSDIVYIGY